MIYKNNKTINEWYFNDAELIKVYKNGAICYYKIVNGSTPSQEPCFAVVDDIQSYSDTEFVDVYDKATEKWYKLNNLDQYEEYGIYGEGRNITYYEGKLTIDNGYEYEWDGSEWSNLGEVSGSTATLPDVPFTVNINAKNYNATTKTFAKTNGQLANTDIVITAGTPVLNDGYVTVSSGSKGTISGYGTYFTRDNNNPTLTIISKQSTVGGRHIFSNRDSNYNWMYRAYNNKLSLHGANGEVGNLAVTTQPVIESVRVNSSRTAIFNNYTDNTTISVSNFNYGASNTTAYLFYGGYYGEYFVGDFYWLYMSQTTLTDEQVQQVIDYNEGNTTTEYPKYYTEKDEPENNVVFEDMEEALAYECPWVGMIAQIGTDLYTFNSDNEWEKLAFTITGITRSSEAFQVVINNASANAIVFEDNGDNTYNFGIVYLDPVTNTTSMASGNTNLVKFDFADADTSQLTTIGNYAFSGCTNFTTFEIPSGVTTIGIAAFNYCNNYTNISIPESITSFQNGAFYRTSTTPYRNVYITDLSKWCGIYFGNNYSNPLYSNGNLYLNGSIINTLTLPSDITQIKQYAFQGCRSIQTLNIPNNITQIKQYAFSGCTYLSTINWGTGLSSLGQYAFSNASIRTLTLPSGITSIPNYCFQSCANLSSVTLTDNVTSIGYNAFISNYNLKTLNLGNGLVSIGNYAFQGDSSISALTIPSGVTRIETQAFRNCSGLISITVEATTPPILGTSVFDNTNNCNIYVPCASVSAYRSATNWSAYSSRIIGFESCTTYDWQVVSGEYICEDGDKYVKEKYIRSFDGGTTWEDVTPTQTRKGSLIEAGSPDCESRLPSGYTEVEYIRQPSSTLRQNVPAWNIPITNMVSGDSFTIVFSMDSSQNGMSRYISIFGSDEVFAIRQDSGYGYNLNTKYFTNANTARGNYTMEYDTKLRFNYKPSLITVTNVATGVWTTVNLNQSSGYNPSGNLGVFGYWYGGTGEYLMMGNVYEIKIEGSDDTLKYDYIPCKRDSDNKVGLYDIVNGLFTSPSGFTITAGPEVF